MTNRTIEAAGKKVAYTVALSKITHAEHTLPKNLAFALIGMLRNESMLKPFSAVDLVNISREASKFTPELQDEIEQVMDKVLACELDGDISVIEKAQVNNQFIPAVCTILANIEETDRDSYTCKLHFQARIELNKFLYGRGGISQITEKMTNESLYNMKETRDTVMSRILSEIDSVLA